MSDFSSKYAIGIDLGGTFVKFNYSKADGEIISRDKIPTRVSFGASAILSDISAKIVEMMKKHGHGPSDVIGCGIGCPGTVDSGFRNVIFAPNLKWKDVNVKDVLEKETGIPVYIDNDANLAALGEYWRGAGKGLADFICVTLGTGIGGGIVVNGQLLRGQDNNAAEIGHMTIDINGSQCGCGGYGCWERYGSATALVERVLNILKTMNQAARPSMSRSKIFDLCSSDLSKLNCEIIFEAAAQNDQVARNAVVQQTEYIAIGLVNLINIFNPQKIVLVGGLAAAGEALFKPVTEAVWKKAPKVSLRNLAIAPGALGGDSGAIGAIYLVLKEGGLLG